MVILPKVDIVTFRRSILAKRKVEYSFSTDWQIREETGRDMGRDLISEYFVDGEATNDKLAIQVKGCS